MKVLWLNEDDVASLLRMEDAIEAVERAFFLHGSGRTQMPPKPYLYFPGYEGDLRTMPAYIEDMEIAGVNVVNVHPRNPEMGLPTVMAVLVLNSPRTGSPVSIMGARHLTAMRTGAAGAVAARHLARPDSRRVGMVGAGVQARTQLMGLAATFGIERVSIYDRSPERASALARDARSFLNCDYRIVREVRDACDCDILVTTTPARSPVVMEEWVMPGTHINAIGADAKGKQELQSSLTRKAKVVVDEMAQAVHSGEVNVPISEGVMMPQDIHAQIGEVLTGRRPGRTSDAEITVFDSTGLGIQDVATGLAVYRRAREVGRGLELEL
ncbi:MAG: alanine dehydrogenase [Methanothrix sp.]|nr:alanine dehydrogenase [Methanothrix sp.]